MGLSDASVPRETRETPTHQPSVAPYVVTVINMKGGVGKTTTSASLAADLAERGIKTLAIDLDPQNHLGICLGVSEEQLQGKQRFCDALAEPIGSETIATEDCIVQMGPNLQLLPGAKSMKLAGNEIQGDPTGQYRLRTRLRDLKDPPAMVVIDCPPDLGALTASALLCASDLVIPAETSKLSVEGLVYTKSVVDSIIQTANPDLKLRTGLLWTRVEGNTKLAAASMEALKAVGFPDSGVVIPKQISVASAVNTGQPISVSEPKSKAGKAYRELTSRIIDNANSRFAITPNTQQEAA